MSSATLRRGGALVAYTYSGHLDPRDLSFPEALQAHRFLTIERAASEETSIGWVTPVDPSGNSFTVEDMDAGGDLAWLRLRGDVKRLPATLLMLKLAEAERAKGRRLSARERRELKDDLIEQVLPGLPPSTAFVDALLDPRRKRVLVLASSKGQREAFCTLWANAVGLPLDRETAVTVGQRHGHREVAKTAPTKWPGGGTPRQLEIDDAAFLGDEFLTWLWFRWEVGGGEFTLPGGRIVGLAIDDLLAFTAAEGETEQVLRHGSPTRTDQARLSLQQGRCVTKAKLILAEGQHQWTCTLDGPSLTLTGVKLPDDAEECDSSDDRTADRAANWLALHLILDELFAVFLIARLTKSRWKVESREMARWMECAPALAGGAT